MLPVGVRRPVVRAQGVGRAHGRGVLFHQVLNQRRLPSVLLPEEDDPDPGGATEGDHAHPGEKAGDHAGPEGDHMDPEGEAVERRAL